MKKYNCLLFRVPTLKLLKTLTIEVQMVMIQLTITSIQALLLKVVPHTEEVTLTIAQLMLSRTKMNRSQFLNIHMLVGPQRTLKTPTKHNTNPLGNLSMIPRLISL